VGRLKGDIRMSDETTQNLVGAQLDQLISLVKNLNDRHTETDARVERLERVLEERLYDTRPIWEAVRAQVQELGGRVGALESEMTGMRIQSTEMLTQMIEMLKQITEMRVENGNAFRAVDRKIGVLGKTLIDMTADIRELQDKVEKIESQPL
jgi:predicted RNase H-like nuclease (RuvC/YqgF family)